MKKKTKFLKMVSLSLSAAMLMQPGAYGQVSVPASNMKWMPGHYILNSASKAATESLLAEFQSIPRMKGLQRSYFWSKLETAKGVYDFKVIDDDLAMVSKFGKKLSIMIGYKYQISATQSSLPNYVLNLPNVNVGGLSVPSYFEQGMPGDGIYNHGQHANFGHPGTLDAFSKLLKALADKYDNNPNVAFLQFIETSVGASISAAQTTRFLNGVIDMDTAARAAFARTPIIQSLNFPRNRLPDFIDNLAVNKMGFGGPDVFIGTFDHPEEGLGLADPNYPGIYRHNMANFNNATGNNKLPIGMQVHDGDLEYLTRGDQLKKVSAYTKTPPAMIKAVYDFSMEFLHPNFLIWQVYPSNDPYKDALKARLQMADTDTLLPCPSIYTSCNGSAPAPSPSPVPSPAPSPAPSPVPPPVVDDVGPNIVFENLSNNEIIGAARKFVGINTHANDSSGVKRMELLINGNLKKTTYSGNLDFSWDVRGVNAGIHEIKIRAIDNHNNVRVKAIDVRVRQ